MFTLIIQTESGMDSGGRDFEQQFQSGRTIAEIKRDHGAAYGITNSMVAQLNNVDESNMSTMVQDGDVLLFREGTKRRG